MEGRGSVGWLSRTARRGDERDGRSGGSWTNSKSVARSGGGGGVRRRRERGREARQVRPGTHRLARAPHARSAERAEIEREGSEHAPARCSRTTRRHRRPAPSPPPPRRLDAQPLAHRGRRVVGDSAQSGRRHTRRVSMATDGDGSSVTLGRHVGSVKGASAGADGASAEGNTSSQDD